MTNRHFVFIEGSSRSEGNTAALARRAQLHLPAGTSSEWISLAELPLPDFEDPRSPGSTPPIYPDGNEGLLLAATLRATDLVIASPLYWYTISAPVKRYLDYWSNWLKIPGLNFRRQMSQGALWGITVGHTDDESKTEGLATSLRFSAEYLGMQWGGLLYGSGGYPGEILQDQNALQGAEQFFARNLMPLG